MRRPGPRRCGCDCHGGEVVVHVHVSCECGKPIRPPTPRPPEGEACPRPETPPQPGIVDVPEMPPHRANTSKTPPWREGKPEPGSPDLPRWFLGKVDEIIRKGPTFGPRKDEFLPYLVIRADAGDNGKRPYSGNFWESPDIYIVPNVEASAAPLTPTTTAGLAQASAPNTLYAHVWNLGKAPASRVRVEFYWCDPSLGISRAVAHLVGATYVDLANRFTLYPSWQEVRTSYGQWLSRGCHAIARCATTWVPSYVNGGHECLVVRAFDPIMDSVPPDQFNASEDRHVGQRNISVAQAASPAELDLTLNLGYAERPGEATVEVELDSPVSMRWLAVYAGRRDPGLRAPSGGAIAGLLPPGPIGGRVPLLSELPANVARRLLHSTERFHRGCDPLQIGFHARADLAPGEAQVVRIRHRLEGRVVGGYTVVLVGELQHARVVLPPIEPTIARR